MNLLKNRIITDPITKYNELKLYCDYLEYECEQQSSISARIKNKDIEGNVYQIDDKLIFNSIDCNDENVSRYIRDLKILFKLKPMKKYKKLLKIQCGICHLENFNNNIL